VPAGHQVVGGAVLFTNLGTLPAGASSVASITVRPLAVGTLTNSATTASGLPDPIKGNNTAAGKTTVLLPTLSQSHAPGTLTLRWPAAASGYSLETATNLVAPVVWIPASNPPPTLVGGEHVYTVGTTNGARYFRLRSTAP